MLPLGGKELCVRVHVVPATELLKVNERVSKHSLSEAVFKIKAKTDIAKIRLFSRLQQNEYFKPKARSFRQIKQNY